MWARQLDDGRIYSDSTNRQLEGMKSTQDKEQHIAPPVKHFRDILQPRCDDLQYMVISLGKSSEGRRGHNHNSPKAKT